MLLVTCTKDKGKIGDGYPEEVSAIITKKCATAGCHTQQSKSGAAGLSLESWNDLFEGNRGGAVCIPFSHEFSTIFLFTNTDPGKGAINEPIMPLNLPSLSEGEMKILTDWINSGAPDSDGKIAFADNSNRKKFYVTNQGCDVVTVFDTETRLQMRYIPNQQQQISFLGASSQIESPHMIKISPDGKHYYISFSSSGTVLQKFRTSDDQKVGEIFIGTGSWNTFVISPDSKKAFVVDWNSSGKIAYLDVENMTTLPGSPWSGFVWPHGSGLSPDGDTLYVTCQTGNFIYKIPVNDPSSFEEISIDPPQLPVNNAPVQPHDMIFSPDNSMYFISCEKSNDVRVFLRSNDSMIAKIPVGHQPVEFAISSSANTPYLFVTCMVDSSTSEARGSVDVINYKTLLWERRIKTKISEPHGIGLDDASGIVFVANRNISNPVPPHHTTNCTGTNGFVSFIDLNSLEVLSKTIEVAVDPYSIAVRK